MPGVDELIAALRVENVRFTRSLKTGRLVIEATKGSLTPELRAAIVEHRTGLLARAPIPGGRCPICNSILTRTTCWGHMNRLCSDCGGWTGRVFLERCAGCDPDMVSAVLTMLANDSNQK